MYDQSCVVDALRRIRSASDRPLFCTFGILTAAAVGRLRETGLCDGAIVGTAVLERLAGSLTDTETLVAELCGAAFD